MTTLLADPYYSEAHAVFRQVTDQTDLMLRRLVVHVDGRSGLTICSVGSGAGLFEMPMLARLADEGIPVTRFVGVDASEHGCAVLERKLEAAGLAGLEFELVVSPFQAYSSGERFDVVLFNHVVEYLHGDALASIVQARELLEPAGSVLVFSPIRGGINVPYEQAYSELIGVPPIFADDIDQGLRRRAIDFGADTMTAACDISLLDSGDDDGTKLLSFLTQRDCRKMPRSVRDEYSDYYRSLRSPGSSTIPHPVTLFVL